MGLIVFHALFLILNACLISDNFTCTGYLALFIPLSINSFNNLFFGSNITNCHREIKFTKTIQIFIQTVGASAAENLYSKQKANNEHVLIIAHTTNTLQVQSVSSCSIRALTNRTVNYPYMHLNILKTNSS